LFRSFHIKNFEKINEDIRSSRCTGGKLIAGAIVNTGGKFIVVSLRPAVTSFPRSTLFCGVTWEYNCRKAANVNGNVGGKFATVVNYCALALTLPPV
jgi:hypothetical protein